MTPQEQAFQDWKLRAGSADLLETAKRFGAQLKRAGKEWVGPCPICQGRDRFAVSPVKQKWICRGSAGGRSPIGMVEHIAGLSFPQACAEITGEPCPSGPVRPLSAHERAAREKVRAENERRQRAREIEEAAYVDDTREAAQRIWDACEPLHGTLAETYLRLRGLMLGEWPDSLRFHPSLPYPGHGRLPALVCRVDDLGANLCAVWRIYLGPNGRKASVPNPKLGLGPAGGGAVRIGGIGPKIGLAEGAESALGAWNLIGRKYPVWAALSTSGLTGVEIPLGVQHVTIFPDGDAAMRKKDGEYVPAVPAGRKAALSTRARLVTEGVNVAIAAEPKSGTDYADLWAALAKEMV